MKISVVIPVLNEEKHIGNALKALTENTVKPDEIIVADGGSSDRTREIVSGFDNVILIDNKEKNAAAGRNRGIECASGDVIAFTDGDCIVSENWIEKIKNAFEESDIDGLGGKIETAPYENEYEKYWGELAWKIIMSFGDTPYVVDKKTLNDAFVTANCAYKKELLDKLGGFDNWFANNAEDIDLCWRALEAGAKLMYVPFVEIFAHSVTSLKGIKSKSFRNGISSSKLQKRYGGKINYDLNIYKMQFQNLIGMLKRKENARLNFIELTWHLFGKYYGSFLARVINV